MGLNEIIKKIKKKKHISSNLFFQKFTIKDYKSFEIDAVTFKIRMTEHHHFINHQAYGLTQQSLGEMSMVNPATPTPTLFL